MLSLLTHVPTVSRSTRCDSVAAPPKRHSLKGQTRLGNLLSTGLNVNVLAKLLTVCLVALAAVACATEVPVTTEVEVTREVVATREIEATREVVVTREVEVTREVMIKSAPEPDELCSDYPFMTRLGALQRSVLDSYLEVGRREIPAHEAVRRMQVNRDRLDSALQSSLVNRIQICGVQPQPAQLMPRGTFFVGGAPERQREMQTFEGESVCSDTIRHIRIILNSSGTFDGLPPEIRDAIRNALSGYVDFCDNDFLE